jgi:hypothetical protein
MFYDDGSGNTSYLGTESQEGFKKYDEGKPRMSLVPPWAIEGVARVRTHGEKKYDAWNWLNPTKWSKFLDAALRHVNALAKSEDIDESGLPTVYHAIAELMILATVMELKIGTDDRPMALLTKMRKAAEEKPPIQHLAPTSCKECPELSRGCVAYPKPTKMVKPAQNPCSGCAGFSPGSPECVDCPGIEA